MKLLIFDSADKLPQDWDLLTKDNPYLRRSFLSFIEKTEKDYRPSYHLFYDGERPASCFVSFPNRRFDIAMFTKATFKRKITLIYLPMSVTRPGIAFGSLRGEVTEYIKRIKGYTLALNLNDGNAPGFATGYTCPKCILSVRWPTFGEYVRSLRSDYRNKLKKVFARSEELTIRFIDNRTEFDDRLYAMYLNVLERSETKIETLSRAYFEGGFFRIFVAELKGQPVGFVQLMENGSELIFEFVGIDYKYNAQYQVYHRMLYEIIRYGIENGFKRIDFGQTADDTKLKLGCRYTYLYAWLHHSNRLVNYLLGKFAPRLVYKPVGVNFRVFREESK